MPVSTSTFSRGSIGFIQFTDNTGSVFIDKHKTLQTPLRQILCACRPPLGSSTESGGSRRSSSTPAMGSGGGIRTRREPLKAFSNSYSSQERPITLTVMSHMTIRVGVCDMLPPKSWDTSHGTRPYFVSARRLAKLRL